MQRMLLDTIVIGVAALFAVAVVPARAAEFSFLHIEDGQMVDEQGRPVVLRGCNLGNWLLIEPWMLGIDTDQTPDAAPSVTRASSRP